MTDDSSRKGGGRWEGREDREARKFVRTNERVGSDGPATPRDRNERFGARAGLSSRGGSLGGSRDRNGSRDAGRGQGGPRDRRDDGGSRHSQREADSRGRQGAARPNAPAPGVPRLRAGEVVTLDVAREVSPNGYFLTDGHQDVLLHYSEATKPIQIGEPLEVFLYHDTEDRLTATMRRPKLLFGDVGLLEVIDIHPRFGLFLEMGLGRNLLLPYSELPELEELRPQVGDSVFVTLANDKQGRLVAKLAGEAELAPKCFAAPNGWRNHWVNARVYKPLQMGTFVVCEGGVVGFGVIGFIPAPERSRLLRLGEVAKVRVTFIREDGRVNLSLRQPKELGRGEDADKVLAFLHARPNGAMPYSDETPADVIAAKFGISKAAFKRALGKLMRERVIYQKGNWTHLSAPTEPSDADSLQQPEV